MQIRRATSIILLFLCYLFVGNLSASHLIGGDASYEFVEFNFDTTRVKFRIRFNLYKDSNFGANLGNREDFGIYEQLPSGEWEWVEEYSARLEGFTDIPGIDEPCREEPPRSVVAVETAYYEEEIWFDIIDENYMIAYLRCCRNDGITNMDGDEKGASIDLIITPLAQRTGNSSPKFNEFPPIFICAGFPLEVSQACSDIDGDAMRYSFCTPIAVGGPNGGGCESPNPPTDECEPPYDELVYQPGYSLAAPMAGNPAVDINVSTGLLTGTPAAVEALYVVGICVEEYRNGQLLSVIRRDFQFNALTCIKDLSADLVADEQVIDNSTSTLPINIIKACGDSLVNFSALDNNNVIDNYHWTVFDPAGEMVIDSSGSDVKSITVFFPDLGEYEGTLVVRDSEDCIDTAKLRVLRLPDMKTDWTYDRLDTCYLDGFSFTDLSTAETSEIIEWEWDMDGEAVYTDQNVTHEFRSRGDKTVRLISKDLNTCVDTMTLTIEYDPPHDSLLYRFDNPTLCYGDSTFFQNRYIKEAGFYVDTIQYVETGCDSAALDLRLAYFPEPIPKDVDTLLCPGETLDWYGVNYSEEGSFFHTTRGKAYDCDSLLHNVNLAYDIIPTLDFAEDFAYVTVGKDYKFPLRITGDYAEIIWTPSDGLSCDDCPDPIVNYDTDTTYTIQISTDIECRNIDSFMIDFVVVPEGYYLPNLINKNAILKEDKSLFLQTQENALGEVEYDMKVLDRWGGLMFDGKNLDINDRLQGWTPGNLAPGAYVYTIEVREFFETRFLFGTVTVVE